MVTWDRKQSGDGPEADSSNAARYTRVADLLAGKLRQRRTEGVYDGVNALQLIWEERDALVADQSFNPYIIS